MVIRQRASRLRQAMYALTSETNRVTTACWTVSYRRVYVRDREGLYATLRVLYDAINKVVY